MEIINYYFLHFGKMRSRKMGREKNSAVVYPAEFAKNSHYV